MYRRYRYAKTYIWYEQPRRVRGPGGDFFYGQGGKNSCWFHVLEFPRVGNRASGNKTTYVSTQTLTEDSAVLPGGESLIQTTCTLGIRRSFEASRRWRRLMHHADFQLTENGAVPLPSFIAITAPNHFKKGDVARRSSRELAQ